LYTVWLQLRQITTLQDQLLAQDRANQETVRIQAMTALVSARSTLMHARYNFNRDLASAAREKRIDESLRPAWEVMQFSNAEAMGKDFQSLQELASELDRILRRESEGEEGSV
jgi:hypothetical protein